ncbi:MAG: hypothetical protein BGO98_27260 [Myxococcales bacterium 68-20]|nr:MAG: hypothetical protein BGO98_27260 [Myxococcales bacterium 68-20]
MAVCGAATVTVFGALASPPLGVVRVARADEPSSSTPATPSPSSTPPAASNEVVPPVLVSTRRASVSGRRNGVGVRTRRVGR